MQLQQGIILKVVEGKKRKNFQEVKRVVFWLNGYRGDRMFDALNKPGIYKTDIGYIQTSEVIL